ncbi:MAG TPA: hypothetical protein VFO84_01915 [Dehalococcoidia bacterium]|nr:hypothetical protein [Dehalococcoidia bacterium]
MQIEWEKTINEILAEQVACRRCGALHAYVSVGYSRAPGSAAWAPRCVVCERKEDCDSRKLVVLCDDCARELRIRARRVDAVGLMSLLTSECRRDLEESLDYLEDYWREDLDIDPSDAERRFEDVAPDAFAEEDDWRRHLEEEYISYHKWFRAHSVPVPEPGWRSQYVEEIIALGYDTLLGD